MEESEADQLLPDKATKAITDPRRLKYLLIGQPKWGKTTLMCSIPDSLLLAFEEGHGFHETHKIIIDCWDRSYSEKKEGWTEDDDGNRHTSAQEAVEAICASNKFSHIIIDTADMAGKMCLDYYYAQKRIEHAKELGDYGVGWDICLTQPFRRFIGPLIRSGRGLSFITHSQIIERKIGNSKISRAESTLPSQVQKFLHTQADVIMHASFGRRVAGQKDRDRIITMDGSNEILAGSRIRGLPMPYKFVVDPDHPWKQWTSFFDKKDGAKNVKAAEDFYEKRMGQKDIEVASDKPEPEPTELSSSEVKPKGEKKPEQRRAARK